MTMYILSSIDNYFSWELMLFHIISTIYSLITMYEEKILCYTVYHNLLYMCLFTGWTLFFFNAIHWNCWCIIQININLRLWNFGNEKLLYVIRQSVQKVSIHTEHLSKNPNFHKTSWQKAWVMTGFMRVKCTFIELRHSLLFTMPQKYFIFILTIKLNL
jgi:hypothetical protein